MSKRILILVGVATVAISIVMVGWRLLPKIWSKSDRPVIESTFEVTDFTLLDHEGVSHNLYRNRDVRYVVLIAHGNGCPIVQKYSATIRELNERYADRQIRFFMINPNLGDERQAIIQEANDYQFGLPILLDPSQIVTEMLGLTRTAEAVVIDTKEWRVVYRGAIDDRMSYGVDKQEARNHYLRDSLDQLLRGEVPQGPFAAAKGCRLTLRKSREISYSSEIVPILAKRCLNCHSEKGKFPPNLKNHEQVVSWAEMIRETVFTDRMPPWSADPMYGKYKNDISLTPDEKHALVTWINQGAKRHASLDPLEMANRAHLSSRTAVDKWRPVFTAKMDRPQRIAPRGTLEYQYIQLGGPVPRDLYIDYIRMRTTNPRQIHHTSLMVASQPVSFFEEIARNEHREAKLKNNVDGDLDVYVLKAMTDYESKGGSKWFSRVQVWGSGRAQPFYFGDNIAMYIPKGHYLILELHYMGTGKEEFEETTLDFYSSRKVRRKKPFRTFMVSTEDFVVPPFVERHKVLTKRVPIRRDIELQWLLGHLHLRGRAVKLLQYGPGKDEVRTLASIPNFYYGWQTGAGLNPDPPIFVPKGAELAAECEFDNSAKNPNNPDPSKAVYFGQTLDRAEMCKINISYTFADPGPGADRQSASE